jgi:toxin ParE1/3/4
MAHDNVVIPEIWFFPNTIIYLFFAEDNEEMVVKTIKEIYARIENIQQFPYMGADLAKRVSFRTDYKYVICGNYVVLYKIGEEYVEIYRVVNRYQDITKIFLDKR